MFYNSNIKKIMKEFKKNNSYSKESVKFIIENYKEFNSDKNDKSVLNDIANIISNDENQSDAATVIFNRYCSVDYVRYFDDISGTKYVDINISSNIPLLIEKKIKKVSHLITKSNNELQIKEIDTAKNEEYTLEHFVGVLHNRRLADRDDSATRLAKLILYLSGHYSLAHEHRDIVPEEKYEKLGLTKPLASKIDTLLKIFNKCCKLDCTRGFANRLGLVDYITAEGEVPEKIDAFVKQKLYEYEKEDEKIADNSTEVSLIEKSLEKPTQKEINDFYNELVK